MTAAVQRIGDLFSSTREFYLWMTLFHAEEFRARLGAVQLFAIEAIPSSTLDVNLISIYERTSKILEAHANGLELMTVMNRGRLYWDVGSFKADLKDIEPLSEEQTKEWGNIVHNVAASIRFVRSRMFLKTQLLTG